ncbi:MAG: carbohydrate-binding family 9-like protein [Acidobacteriota bacterium]
MSRPTPPVPELLVPRLRETDRLVALPRLLLRDARTGGGPRLPTSLRMGLRGNTLCVRFDGKDAGVVASYTRRDDPLWEEDVFEVFLAAGEDPPLVYFEFEINPLGALFDARIQSPEGRRSSMRTQTEWDCLGFTARVAQKGGSWSASVRIPLESLAPGPLPRVWRANFFRIDRGTVDEFSAWSPPLTDPADFHVPERFGILRLDFP